MYQRIFSKGMTSLFMVLLITGLFSACNSDSASTGEATADDGTEMTSEESNVLPPLDSIEAASNISDADLELFLDAVEAVQVVSQEAQQQMVAFVEGEGISLERFSQIQQKLQAPASDLPPITAEEEEKLDRIESKVRALEPELERQSAEAVREIGLTPLRYQQLSKGIQQDPELSQKAQSIMQQRMMQRLQEAAGAQPGGGAPANQ